MIAPALQDMFRLRDDWTSSRLKFALCRNDGGVWGDDYDDAGRVVLRSTEVEMDGSWCILDPARRRLSIKDFESARLVEGDLLVTKSSGSESHLGKTALVTKEVEELNAAFSNFMQRLRMASGHVPRYYYYLLNSSVGRDYLGCLGSTTTGLRNLSGGVLSELALCGPSGSEQTQIAKFLDYETARIDALIEKQEQLIGLLKEKRQAVISHAVTKGLNPDAPMRDSGVEWLGEVPAHWSISYPKYFCTKIIDGPHHTPDYVDEGVPFVTVKNLTSGEGISLDDTKRITPEAHAELLKRAHPEVGDVLITKDGTLGVTRVIETDKEFSIFVSVALLKFRRDLVDPYFLRYSLESSSAWTQFKLRAAGAALQHIVLTTIGNVMLPLPSLEEQQIISKTVTEKCHKIDELLGVARQCAELLRERRTALISAAVTGKIDVRNWQPPAQAKAEVA